MWDTDFWWHLKTGELILETGAVPQVDQFTYTDADKPWIDLHWGFQVLLALIYRVGGINLVILVKAATITAAVALAWCAGGRRVPVWLKTALWIPAVICITGRGYERPEVISQLFLAAWLWIVIRLPERPKLIWFLPAVQLIWVNCHALFVLGLVVGGAYIVDCIVREFAGGQFGLPPVDRWPTGRTIIRAAALAVVGCLANPYFEEGLLFPLTLFQKFSVEYEFYSKFTGEFRAPWMFLQERGLPGLFNIYFLSEVVVFGAAAVSFALLFWKNRRWNLFRALLFAGFSYLAWKMTRNTNIFVIVATVVACENLHEAWGFVPRTAPQEQESRPMRNYPVWVVAQILVALILLILTNTWVLLTEEGKQFALGERPNWFIHDAAKFAGQPGFPNMAFIATNGHASTYSFYNGPERKIFMDARLEVVSKPTFEMHNKIMELMAKGELEWQQLLYQSSGGEMPVVILDSRFSRAQINLLLITPGWRLVFADRAAAVFLTETQADNLSLAEVSPEPLIYPDGLPHK